MTASTIMERLKSETAHYHRQVEQNDYAKAIMNQTVSLEEYILAKFYGFKTIGRTSSAAAVLGEYRP